MSQPTPQQRQAIDARGAILLTAGAGTGKTATLVQRCLRLVIEAGVDIDRLLVVTFTNAAAAEMKQRLREALRHAATQPDAPEALQRQLLLLEAAPIATLHSFCLDLIRTHFAELHLDPAVAVLDESLATPLARQTARRLALDALANDPDTRTLADHYCQARIDPLVDLLLETHRFFVAQPRAARCLDAQLNRFEPLAPNAWNPLRPSMFTAWLLESAPAVRTQIPLTIEGIEQDRNFAGKSPTGEGLRHLTTLLPSLIPLLDPLPNDATIADWTRRLDALLAFADDSLWARGSKKHRGCLEDFLEDVALLRTWCPTDGLDPLDVEWTAARAPMSALLRLARQFATAFTDAKRALGGVDFADLEQLALELLTDPEGRPTPVALEWRERFEHVFVDECQDINPAQEAILQALARHGEHANLFMVGDVKQSIYRFRMAAPDLFQRHLRQWPALPHHQVLPLTENFRSRAGIVAFVNALFDTLMQPRLGDVGYGPADRLAFALPDRRAPLSLHPPEGQGPQGAAPDPDCRVELHLIREVANATASADTGADDSGADPWEDLLELERQAHVIAARLRELMDGQHQVWDRTTHTFRPMTWNDVGILLRSVSGRSGPFLREFRRRAIPLSVEQGDFLDTLEASDLTSLLRLLDNPRQDIPLFAVLRSPWFGWSLDQLVQLRLAGAHGDAWERLEHAAQQRNAHGQAARDFLQTLERWRRLALMSSLTCVLETALAETRYEAFLLTLPDGPDRVANVRRYLDLARRYDPLQRQGLFRFLRFLDDQRDAGREIDPLPPRRADAVQWMSIHKSKGLEFPVVVVAGLSAPFHFPASKAPLILSRTVGPAPQFVDLPARRRHESLVLWHARREERAASLAEELRLLYVAVTRARDTLILVGACKPESRTWIERTSLPPAAGVPRALRATEWIGLWLGGSLDGSIDSGEATFGEEPDTARLRWHFHAGTLEPREPSPSPGDPDLPPDDASARMPSLDLTPAKDPASLIPAKTSASALRRLGPEPDAEAAPAVKPRHRPFPAARPRDDAPGSPTRIGTAHHLFLQHLDLTPEPSDTHLHEHARTLVTRGILRDSDLPHLDLAAIAHFWRSPLGAEIRTHALRVRRELPFTAAFHPSELPAFATTPPPDPDEFIVVQGAVDLAVLLPTETWLVDFKTDHITLEEIESRAADHRHQLQLYATALERIHRRPVTRSVLHFLHPRHTWSALPA
ncbi:MAG: UvrD-helicase domain-containing protein [Verrucomicrobiae bacterium]|nr:UvrD-helicase domain-containing protein [Verrucomicrobiae bacterium]